MSGQGIAQILVYAVVLIALAYPLGLYMARVYAPDVRRALAVRARGRLLPPRAHGSGDGSRTGRATRRRVIVFTILFFGVLYAIQRLQAHLFLNPDHLPAVPSHIALNTTASFVTNTNWQYYGGEYTMSYLTQMAGLAVQQFVSAAVGMAVLVAVDPRVRAAVRRASSATSGSTSTGRSSTSCCRCRSILGADPALAGRAADLLRPRDRARRSRARRRRSRAARSR